MKPFIKKTKLLISFLSEVVKVVAVAVVVVVRVGVVVIELMFLLPISLSNLNVPENENLKRVAYIVLGTKDCSYPRCRLNYF
jgi:hypothetical protein